MRCSYITRQPISPGKVYKRPNTRGDMSNHWRRHGKNCLGSSDNRQNYSLLHAADNKQKKFTF